MVSEYFVFCYLVILFFVKQTKKIKIKKKKIFISLIYFLTMKNTLYLNDNLTQDVFVWKLSTLRLSNEWT